MKNIKYLFLFLTLGLIFTSCKKDDPEEEQTTTQDFEVYVGDAKISNGYVWEVTSIENNNLVLNIKNISNSKIFVKMKINEIVGTNPAPNIQFCIGDCYRNIDNGVSYPLGNGLEIETNSDSGGLVHIDNDDDRNEIYTLDVTIYQVDENGNELANKKTISFKYKYNVT